MSTRGDIPIYLKITGVVKTVDVEKLKEIQRIAAQLQEAGLENMRLSGTMASGMEGARSSSVRLALSLRTLSIGLMILRRELGGISPTVDALIQGMYLTGGAISTAYGAMQAYQVVTAGGALTTAQLGTQLGKLKTFLMGGSMAASIFVGVLGAILTVEIHRWIYNWTSGINAINREIKKLEESMKDLELVMLDITAAQLDLGLQSSQVSLEIARLQYQIDMQGYATAAQTERMKALERAEKGYNLQLTETAFEAQVVSTQLEHADIQMKKAQADLEERQKRWLPTLYFDVLRSFPGIFPQGLLNMFQRTVAPGLQPPEAQIGGEARRGGLVRIHAGEIVSRREPVLEMSREIREIREFQKESVIQQAAQPMPFPPITVNVPEPIPREVIREMESTIVERPLEPRQPIIEIPSTSSRAEGPISIAISFPNAVFQTGLDIEEALQRAGRLAGYEFRRGLELDRRRIRGR